MTERKAFLKDFKKIDGLKIIFGGNYKLGKTEEISTIDKNGLEIKEVSYVKGFKFILLSTSQLCDKGYILEFNQMECKIKHIETHKVVMIRRRHKNVYLVDWSIVKDEVCFSSKGSEELSILWHKIWII